MAAQGSETGVEKLFPELTGDSAQPDPAVTGAGPSLPLPAVIAAGGGRGGGPGPVMHRHEQIRQVVASMEKDLTSLRHSLTALRDGSMGHGVGQWDVAKSLGTKVGAAHGNMLNCIEAYCKAYESVIDRLQQTAKTYADAEEAARQRSRMLAAGLAGADGVRPWRTG